MVPDTLFDKPEDFVDIESNFTKCWIPENRLDFSNSFDENVINEIHEQVCGLNEQSDQNAIDSLSEKLAKLFISTAQKVGMCKKKKKNNKKPRKHPNQPWFNNECESERNIYLDFKNSFSFTHDKKLY